MISESMLTSFFRKTAVSLAEHGNIQEKYIELYAKAMEVALATGINLLAALVIGYCMGVWWYCVIFLAAFIPLRSYAGGYHARGYVACFVQSCVFLIAVLAGIKYLALESRMLPSIWQLFLISVVVVALCSPLADANRPISEREISFFRKRTRIIVILETILALILNWLRVDYSYAIIMAVILSAFALVLQTCVESLKSYREQKEINT